VTGLVLASLRHRRGGLLAGFLSVFLGTAIVTAFASMLDTGLQPSVAGADRTTLMIIASVVGGWGALIVASAVAATVAVATRQRATELALLRSLGARPRQVTTLITGEMAVVAGLGALLAQPFGYVGGRVLLAMLRSTHQVSEGTHFSFGAAALGVGLTVGFGVAVVATRITAGRAARRPVADALLDAATGTRRIGRVRLWAGLICVGIAAQNVVLTLTILDGKNVYNVQAIASEACVFAGIGFALLAPVLLSGGLRLLGPAFRAAAGQSSEIAADAMQHRISQAATPLMPIIVVTSMATGTLYMQAITNSLPAKGADKSVETLNYVIVAMVSVFAAVMLVNLLVVTVGNRRREFAQQRLLGATPRQLQGIVGAESGLLLVIGLTFGSVGALMTVVPFSVAVTHRPFSSASPGIYLAVVTVVTVLTVGTTVLTTRRSNRVDAMTVLRLAGSA
jgi:putative ABC transport system permease protein